MSVLSFFGCAFDRHKPVRRDVEWNGRAFSGTCRHCGTTIERYGRRNWRKGKQVSVGGDGAKA